MNYELAINIIDIVIATTVIIMLSVAWYYMGYFFLSFKKVPEAPKSDKYTKFAILVPARNESQVVGNIINAFKLQTYPKSHFDVFFIVEDANDPTIKMAKKAGFSYFVRDELTEKRRTKGFALQECIRYLKKQNMNYDAYMIFDADNVMEKDFIEKMNNVRQTGVQVCSGYRNFTNAATNWLTACSATLFTYMNTFTSRGRTILFKKASLFGTGYYVDAKIIDDAGGWIFTGMTEDTELTNYCYYHDVNMRYYPLAVFYDEQSPKLRVNRNQHIRWIWGFLYKKKNAKTNKDINYHTLSKVRYNTAIFEYKLGLIPFAVVTISNFIAFAVSIVFAILSLWQSPTHTTTLFYHVLGQFLLQYLFFVFIALVTIIHDNKYLKFNFATILWASSTYCFFFAELLFAFIDGLIHPRKRKTWSPIKHTGKIRNKDAKKTMHK